MKEDYQKVLQMLTLFFLLNPVPLTDKVIKQKGPRTSDQSLFRFQNKFRKIPSLVIYCLTKFDDVIIFELHQQICCKSIHDIMNYSTYICTFESGKFGKEGKKMQKFEYLENKKCFSDETKNIFHGFLMAIIW